ncbi:MAG: hypothetical protein KAJ07_00860 [Planctomycetes bacterium]|nr:hypothetical protein [Planctomycetota bacterium]
MDEVKALEVVRALADGVDPESGEVFGSGSVYQRPDVIRAMFEAVKALEKSVKAKQRKKNLPQRVGKPWDNEEAEKAATAYDKGFGIKEIATKHQRTNGAIKSQLVKMGKISKDEIQN